MRHAALEGFRGALFDNGDDRWHHRQAMTTGTRRDRLSRFEVSPSNPNQALANSELILIHQIDEAANHNGGDLHFGPDCYLYVTLGDEGGATTNSLEYLTGTDPMTGGDAWGINVRQSGDDVAISFPQIANLGFQIEWTPGLSPPVVWQPLDVPGNRPSYLPTNFTATISDAIAGTAFKYYRVRVFEP